MASVSIADVLQRKRQEYLSYREDYLRSEQVKQDAAILLFQQVIKLFKSLAEAGLQIPSQDDARGSYMVPLSPIRPGAVSALLKYPPRGIVRIWTLMDEHLDQELFAESLLQEKEEEPYLAVHVDYGLTEEYPIQDGVYLFSDKTKKEAVNFLMDLLVTIEGLAHEELESVETSP